MGAQQDHSLPTRAGSKADGNNATKGQPCRPNFTDRDTELRGAEGSAQEMLLSGPGVREWLSGQKDGTVRPITCTLGSCSRFPAFALWSRG